MHMRPGYNFGNARALNVMALRSKLRRSPFVLLTMGLLFLLTYGLFYRLGFMTGSRVSLRLTAARGLETLQASFPAAHTKHTGPRVAAVITTSRRPLLFRRAILSFRMRCLDCMERVEHWFAVDDGSTPEQLAEMQATMPGLTWLSKAPAERGHVGSLNVLLRRLRDYDFVVFIEDDFFFIKDEAFVTRAIDVLNANAVLGQVVFNERYALTSSKKDRERMVGGIDIVNPATGQVDYIMCDNIPALLGDLGLIVSRSHITVATMVAEIVSHNMSPQQGSRCPVTFCSFAAWWSVLIYDGRGLTVPPSIHAKNYVVTST